MLLFVYTLLFFNSPVPSSLLLFFFFNDTATTEIYTLSLHDALPISRSAAAEAPLPAGRTILLEPRRRCRSRSTRPRRSEEHTSELQSRQYLVCRLLLEKKKKKKQQTINQNTSNQYKTMIS